MRNTGPTSEQAISFQPEMDPPGGEYSAPVEVEISVHLPLEKVWVHFTTDGRAPTKLSPLYQKADPPWSRKGQRQGRYRPHPGRCILAGTTTERRLDPFLFLP